MAELSIVQKLISGAEVEVPMLSGTIEAREWRAISTPRNAEARYEEKFEIVINDVNESLLHDGKVLLDALLENAERAANNTIDAQTYWLRIQPDGATAATETLLFGGSYQLQTFPGVDNLQTLFEQSFGLAQLTLLRGGIEDVASTNSNTVTLDNRNATLTLPVGGTHGGRIQKTTVVHSTSRYISKFWAGIKPRLYEFGASDWIPTWDVHEGSGVQTSTEADAGTASGSREVFPMVDPATISTRNDRRLSLRLSDIAASGDDLTHYIGRYRILIRMRCIGAGIAARLRVTAGINDGEAVEVGSVDVTFDDYEEWQIVELQNSVQIPEYSFRQLTKDLELGQFGFHFYVDDLNQTYSASEKIVLDYIRLMPADHFVRCDIDHSTPVGSFNFPLYVFTYEDGEIDAIGEIATQGAYNQYRIDENNWSLPVEGGELVIATSQEDDSGTNEAFSVTVQHVKQHRLFA